MTKRVKLLVIAGLAAIIGFVVLVLLFQAHWDGSFGPAKISLRLRDQGELIVPKVSYVNISKIPQDSVKLKVCDDHLDIDICEIPCGGRFSLFGWFRTGNVEFDILVNVPGYEQRKLSYPDDFDIVNYNHIEKIEWMPEVEFHGRTLYLKRKYP